MPIKNGKSLRIGNLSKTMVNFALPAHHFYVPAGGNKPNLQFKIKQEVAPTFAELKA